jgi:hypothetical protein
MTGSGDVGRETGSRSEITSIAEAGESRQHKKPVDGSGAAKPPTSIWKARSLGKRPLALIAEEGGLLSRSR